MTGGTPPGPHGTPGPPGTHGTPGPPGPLRPAAAPAATGPAPPSRPLTVGIGAGRGVDADEVLGLVRRVLEDAGHPVCDVAELASVDAKAAEPGLLRAADLLRVPLRTFPAEVLCGVEVPTPSEGVRAAVATPSVAEAAALAASGTGGRLLVRKTASVPPDGRTAARATAAVACSSRHLRGEAAGEVRRGGGHDGRHHARTDIKENQ